MIERNTPQGGHMVSQRLARAMPRLMNIRPGYGLLIVISATLLLPSKVHGQASVWKLSSEPLLSIGAAEGREGQVFTSILGAARLHDGRYVVADHRELRVNVYDAKGAYLRGFGTRGGGPGEFQSIRGFWVHGLDTIAVWDSRSRRITRFRADGTVVRSDRIDVATGSSATPAGALDPLLGVTPEGGFVLAWIAVGSTNADGLGSDRMTFGVFNSAGALMRSFGQQNGMLRLVTTVGSGPHAFSPFPWAVVIGDTLVYTNGANGEIHFYHTGTAANQPNRTHRLTGTSLSLRDAWAVIDRVLPESNVAAPIAAQTRATNRSIGAVPRIGKMIADDRGRLWIKEYDPATDAIAVGAHRSGGQWLVMETNGRLIANISFPSQVSPVAIYGDDVLCISRDALDVQRFVVYRLLR